MDGQIPIISPAQFPRGPAQFPRSPAQFQMMAGAGRLPFPLPIMQGSHGDASRADVVKTCMMYNSYSNPAQFQLPPGFQQLLDPVPIMVKQEPLDLQHPTTYNLQQPPPLSLQQAPAKGKAKPKKKKVKKEPQDSAEGIPGEDGTVPIKKLKQEKITEHLPVKKKRDRFNGMPEEEVVLRLLPDHLVENLDIVIVGINPGLYAAYVGHHYAGPGNHFWKCLYLSGLIPEPMNAYQDFELPKYGIGFTNICARTTRGSADLKKTEIKEGAVFLKEKLIKYKPKIAVFNGKGIYEIYHGSKNFALGKQPEPVEGTNTLVYVMPSSSARCAQLPRAIDKVPFYLALKKLRDYCRGDVPTLIESDVCFPDYELKIKTEPKTEPLDDTGGVMTDVKPPLPSKAKPKSKGKKKSTPPKSSQSQNIPVPTSDSQPVNGMLPIVKQEKPYDASEFGGQSYGNPAASIGMGSSAAVPYQQNAQVYSHPAVQNSFVSTQNGVNAPVSMANAMVRGRTDAPGMPAMFYPGGAQPLYQGQMYVQTPYMQPLQVQNINQTDSQASWQQYPTYPANQAADNNTAANQRPANDPQLVQVKTEPQEYGYTEISFNNM